MIEEMGLLIQVQRIDTQLAKFNENEQQCRNRIETERTNLEALQQKVEETRAQLDATARERRDKESEMEIQEQLLTKTQSRLKEIKTNKEYQAHLHEIDALKKGRGTIEEAVLLLMDKMEVLKSEMDLQEKNFKEKEQKFLESVKAIEDELLRLREDQQKMEEERKRLTGQINNKILHQYEHLLRTKKGSAIAALKDNTCQGCNMNLPPQLIAEVKRNDKFLTCSYCYRILYWQEFYLPRTA